jgi:hypothetical protein
MKKKIGYGADRVRAKKLSSDQVRFNRSAKKKGTPGSKPWKKYVFGHATNVRKGKA